MLMNKSINELSYYCVAVQRHADVAFQILSQIPGLKPTMPQGAMYMMVSLSTQRTKSSFCVVEGHTVGAK